MLRLLADENLNAEIVQGLLRREPTLDVIQVEQAGLQGADDSAILEWAAGENRVVLTHDRATLPAAAYDRVRKAAPMPGVFVIDDRASVGAVIEDVLLFALCSEDTEWANHVLYLP